MKKKYIFFDIDGTLTNDNPGGIVLPSTIDTLEKLKNNGHYVAIATGRGYKHAREFMEANGFDNMVCDGGNGVVINGELQWVIPMDYNLSMAVIEECLEKGLGFGVNVGDNDILYYTGNVECKLRYHFETKYVPSFKDIKNIYKIFINANYDQEAKLESIKAIDHVRYHDDVLIVEPIDKYSGIIDFVNLVGGDLDDVVVFGDAKNDLSMAKQAPIAIAMGNAIDELKEVATYVTKSNKDDGIQHACIHFGWIE